MWWSCFTYDNKGPYHIWEKETQAEKEACKKDLEARNTKRYEQDKALWELERAVEIIAIIAGGITPKKAEFKHDKSTGAYVLKQGKGGINWYRYQEVILKPLLIPFAKECLKKRPSTQVQEDGAPAHASKYQAEVFSIAGVIRLLWPPNSPDLNMIEPCWFWMKRQTTKRGPLTSKAALKAAWIKCWKDMPQEKIQAWIERIMVHIQEVIRLEGGNEYKEGRLKGKVKNRVY
jgi:transposase